jgi:hypothetical protein
LQILIVKKTVIMRNAPVKAVVRRKKAANAPVKTASASAAKPTKKIAVQKSKLFLSSLFQGGAEKHHPFLFILPVPAQCFTLHAWLHGS